MIELLAAVNPDQSSKAHGAVVVAVLGDPGVRTAGLRRAAVGSLGEAKRPRAYYRLTALPVAPTGKLSRRLLTAWITEGDPRVSALE